jgi:hypothetical protein
VPNNITIELSAKDAELVAAWQRQKESVFAFEDSLKKTHQTSKAFTDDFSKGLEDFGKGLVAGYAGLEGVKKGVELVEEAYDEWYQKIGKTVDAQRESREEIARTLVLANKLRDAPLIEEGLKGIGGATRAEKMAAFSSIAEATPDLSAQRQLDLTREIAPLAAAAGEKGLGEIGRVAGVFQAAAPSRSAFDVANIADVAMGQVAPNRRGELADPATMRALEILQHKAGMSLEGALGFETEAMSKGLAARDLQKIAVALVDHMPNMQHPAHITRDNIDKYNFAHIASPEARLDALAHNEKMRRAILGEKESEFFGLMSQEGIAARSAAFLSGHAGEGSIATKAAQFEAVDPLDARRHRLAVEKERHTEKPGVDRDRRDVALDEVKEFALDHVVGRNWLTEFAVDNGMSGVNKAIGAVPYGHAVTDAIVGKMEVVLSALVPVAHHAQEMLSHLNEQTHLLRDIAKKPETTVNVHPPAPSRGPRINAVHRDHVSESAVLGANH